MANFLTRDTVDFSAYIRETEPQQKVRPPREYVQDLIDCLGIDRQERRAYLPWDKTHNLFQFRPGEVTLWGGVNGHGKSLITGMVALSLPHCHSGHTAKERACLFPWNEALGLGRHISHWSCASSAQLH